MAGFSDATLGLSAPLLVMLVFFFIFTSILTVYLSNKNKNLLNEIRILSEDLNHCRRLALPQVLDHFPLPVWRLGNDGQLIFCNRYYAECLGLTPEEAVRRNAHLTDMEEGVITLPLIHQSTRRNFRLHQAKIEGGLFGYGIDITDQMTRDEQMKLNTVAFREVMQNLSAAVVIYGHDRRVQYFNHAYVRLFDMDEKWLSSGPTLGEVLDDLYRRRKMQEQSDYAAYKKHWQELLQAGLSPLEELTHLPDGRTLRHITAPHPLGGLILIFEDVTSTLKLEREYNTQLAVHRASLDNLKEGVAVLGSDNCLRLYNPALAELWQLGPRQLKPNMHITKVAEHLRKYFDYGEDWLGFRDKLVARITDRVKKEQRILRKDGKVIDFTYSPLPDGSHLISCIDMTDSSRIEKLLREKNEALETADRLKSEFISNVSYELRTPLHSVIGFGELLHNEYFGTLNTKQKDYCQGILTASHQLLSLINDTLDLATIEAGHMTLKPKDFAVKGMLRSLMGLARMHAQKKGVKLVLDAAPDLGEFSGDEARLKQALFNLLSNAIRVSPKGTTVHLVASREGLDIIFTVTDAGPGIGRAQQRRLFSPFSQSPDESGVTSTTGLSLALVKRLIELHGGQVKFKSKLNVGTTVTCTLPQRAQLSLDVAA